MKQNLLALQAPCLWIISRNRRKNYIKLRYKIFRVHVGTFCIGYKHTKLNAKHYLAAFYSICLGTAQINNLQITHKQTNRFSLYLLSQNGLALCGEAKSAQSLALSAGELKSAMLERDYYFAESLSTCLETVFN